jgi:hypothetical protein
MTSETQREVEQRRKYHRDYYARNKAPLRIKALRRAYEQYLAFMAPKGESNAKANGKTEQ